jgi:mannose-6-phosphate isomerase-like protein (cupin superfamily)
MIVTTKYGGKNMKNFSKISVSQDARTELHDKLSLTGAEISINNLPAGGSVPFIHSHKNNEEIYVILSGKGRAVIDKETVNLAAGDWIRISPAGKRQFFAAEDSKISFACIQVKENSLEGYTAADAVVEN